MTTFTQLAPVSANPPEPFTGRLRLAVAAYLARFKGSSREHTESDLRCCLSWCAERGLDPLAAKRPYLELYIRWMQEIRRFKLSTVSRRFSVAVQLSPGSREYGFGDWPRRRPCLLLRAMAGNEMESLAAIALCGSDLLSACPDGCRSPGTAATHLDLHRSGADDRGRRLPGR